MIALFSLTTIIKWAIALFFAVLIIGTIMTVICWTIRYIRHCNEDTTGLNSDDISGIYGWHDWGGWDGGDGADS